MSYGRLIALVCESCEEPFTRRRVDAGRGKLIFCSKRCQGDRLRTGRRMVELPCNGCGAMFKKLPSEAKRSAKHFCTQACYLAQVDRTALGRAGAAGPRNVPPLARFLRAQKAGLARARNLSPERLREIALMGVAARLAKKATRGPYRSLNRRHVRDGLQFVGPLLRRETTAGPAAPKRRLGPKHVNYHQRKEVDAEA